MANRVNILLCEWIKTNPGYTGKGGKQKMGMKKRRNKKGCERLTGKGVKFLYNKWEQNFVY